MKYRNNSGFISAIISFLIIGLIILIVLGLIGFLLPLILFALVAYLLYRLIFTTTSINRQKRQRNSYTSGTFDNKTSTTEGHKHNTEVIDVEYTVVDDGENN